MKISAVLFDIGGVLIELNGLPSLAKLLDSNQSLDDIYKRWMAAPAVIAHETGRLTTDQFAQEIVKDLTLNISPEVFIENFKSWIVGVFPDTFALLDAMPNTIQIAALSNTSPTHWQEVAATGLADKIEHLFLSHKIGHLKPTKASFQAAIDGLNVPAKEIIFFDDTMSNIRAAKALGFCAHQALNPEQAKQVLTEYGLI